MWHFDKAPIDNINRYGTCALYAFVYTNLLAVCTNRCSVCTNLCSVCTVHQPGCTNLRAVCSCVLSAPIPQERASNQYCPACIQSFAIDENQQKRWSISRKRFQRWRQMINLKAGHGDLVLHFQYTEQTSTSKTYITYIKLIILILFFFLIIITIIIWRKGNDLVIRYAWKAQHIHSSSEAKNKFCNLDFGLKLEDRISKIVIRHICIFSIKFKGRLCGLMELCMRTGAGGPVWQKRSFSASTVSPL